MLQVANLRVRSFDVDHLDLYWDLKGDDPLSYTLQVLRSENQFGPFRPITHPFKDRYRYRDSAAGRGNHHRVWYYKVKVARSSDGDSGEAIGATKTYPEGPGAALVAPPDLAALEMARLERLRLQEFKGRLVWVFPIRTTGTRCTCFDPITRQRVRANCLTCFDVGFVGGYYNPMQIYMEIANPVEQTQMASQAELKPTNTIGRLANWPIIHERFIVVEAENIRWRLAGPIQRPGKLRATIRQEFRLHKLSMDDVAYKLPIILDPKDLQASPIRQFTNPQNLEGATSVPELTEVGAGLMVGLTGSVPATGGGGVAKLLVSTQTNGSASSLAADCAVSLVPASHPEAATSGVVLANATGGNANANQLSDFYGILKAGGAAGASVDVVRYGQAAVKKVGAEEWEVGDRIYLTTTPGKVSKTAPDVDGTWVVQIGYAAGASTGTLGSVDISPTIKVLN